MQNVENNGQENSAGHTLELIIEGSNYKWDQQYITGFEIRELGRIAQEDEIFLAIQRPWEDELVKDSDRIDLARPGIEHFFTKVRTHGIVAIFINGPEFKILRGKYTVNEIKQVGQVPLAYELEEKIDGKLTPLKDDAFVHIKGGEEFFGHQRDGSSS